MATRSGVWRACLSDLLLATGVLMLLGAGLIWARSALAAQETANHRYLAASISLSPPLPDREGLAPLAVGLPSPTPASPKKQLNLEQQIINSEETPHAPVSTPVPSTPPETEKETETDLPPSNPIVYLEIPAIKVKRAVVPVGIRPDKSGAMAWDTDAIFATNNRPDLVGHLIGSAYPGQGGNIILIGHNYNQVDYGWEGVFVNIKNLKAGDRIIIRGQDGQEYAYAVQLVKQVPWRSKNANELEKHFKFLGPSSSERLTLVTCGGANIWPFPARVYVVAVPEGN